MTNKELAETLRPLFDLIFGEDGYFFIIISFIIGLMVAFAFCSWLAHLIVYRDRRKRRNVKEEHRYD